MNDSSCGSTYCLYCVESHKNCNPCKNGELGILKLSGRVYQGSLKGAGKWEVTNTNVFCLWLDDIFFPWLTLLLRNLILCYIWTSLYNGRPLQGSMSSLSLDLWWWGWWWWSTAWLMSEPYIWTVWAPMGQRGTFDTRDCVFYCFYFPSSLFLTFLMTKKDHLRLWYTLSLPWLEDKVVIIKLCRARKPCAELA